MIRQSEVIKVLNQTSLMLEMVMKGQEIDKVSGQKIDEILQKFDDANGIDFMRLGTTLSHALNATESFSIEPLPKYDLLYSSPVEFEDAVDEMANKYLSTRLTDPIRINQMSVREICLGFVACFQLVVDAPKPNRLALVRINQLKDTVGQMEIEIEDLKAKLHAANPTLEIKAPLSSTVDIVTQDLMSTPKPPGPEPKNVPQNVIRSSPAPVFVYEPYEENLKSGDELIMTAAQAPKLDLEKLIPGWKEMESSKKKPVDKLIKTAAQAPKIDLEKLIPGYNEIDSGKKKRGRPRKIQQPEEDDEELEESSDYPSDEAPDLEKLEA
jgi:hypothetical protein